MVVIVGVLLIPTLIHAGDAEQSVEALWIALKEGGHIALLRHAIAPGTGDPPEFRVEDCATQRNLSEEGREQARRIGQEFRDRDITIGRVFSSQWCRCLETAKLLDLGPVEPFPVLNSFFRHRERKEEQTAALRRFIGTVSLQEPSLVLVTHQVNITALTDISLRSGEIIVIRPLQSGEFVVLGHIPHQ